LLQKFAIGHPLTILQATVMFITMSPFHYVFSQSLSAKEINRPILSLNHSGLSEISPTLKRLKADEGRQSSKCRHVHFALRRRIERPSREAGLPQEQLYSPNYELQVQLNWFKGMCPMPIQR
jgi:hypothetical protein